MPKPESFFPRSSNQESNQGAPSPAQEHALVQFFHLLLEKVREQRRAAEQAYLVQFTEASIPHLIELMKLLPQHAGTFVTPQGEQLKISQPQFHFAQGKKELHVRTTQVEVRQALPGQPGIFLVMTFLQDQAYLQRMLQVIAQPDTHPDTPFHQLSKQYIEDFSLESGSLDGQEWPSGESSQEWQYWLSGPGAVPAFQRAYAIILAHLSDGQYPAPLQ